MKKDNKNKILEDYEKRTEQILDQMLKVLLRAQRKIDDKAYRNILSKMK